MDDIDDILRCLFPRIDRLQEIAEALGHEELIQLASHIRTGVESVGEEVGWSDEKIDEEE